MGFFDRPISLGLFFATIALIAAPYLLAKRRRVR
jgi:hypothetical protein